MLFTVEDLNTRKPISNGVNHHPIKITEDYSFFMKSLELISESENTLRKMTDDIIAETFLGDLIDKIEEKKKYNEGFSFTNMIRTIFQMFLKAINYVYTRFKALIVKIFGGDRAITKYKEKNNDISWKIIYNLSLLYKQKREYKQAEQYAEYLLLNSPSLPDFVPIPDNDKFKIEYIIEISKLNSYFKQNLAEIYIEENKLEEALKLLKQSLIINNYIYGKNSVYTLCNHYKLYNLYSIKNDKQQKEKEYLEINNIKSKILGTKDLRIEQLREVCKI